MESTSLMFSVIQRWVKVIETYITTPGLVIWLAAVATKPFRYHSLERGGGLLCSVCMPALTGGYEEL